ncbi:MAG: hypothetical protein JW867_04535 [Candidatus Omnitrophica bacterium]|nr:hypothetical protein [Candidatus Omnitrophota bacterium]
MNLFGYLPIHKIMGSLILSYFVLIVAAKTDSGRLKIFGRMLAFTLWIIAAYLAAMSYYMQVSGLDYFYSSGGQKIHCMKGMWK